MSKPSLVTLTIKFMFLSAFYVSSVSGNSDFDYAAAKSSDFNGIWSGVVECSKSPDKYPQVKVEIRDGTGYLMNFGDKGSVVSGDLDLDNGWAINFRLMVDAVYAPVKGYCKRNDNRG